MGLSGTNVERSGFEQVVGFLEHLPRMLTRVPRSVLNSHQTLELNVFLSLETYATRLNLQLTVQLKKQSQDLALLESLLQLGSPVERLE